MDAIGTDVLIPVAAALVALLAGVLFGRLRGRGRIKELEVRLLQTEGQIDQLETQLANAEQERDEAVEELSGYQAEVVGHFSQTSELLKEMTLQYRNIYEHLAEGAEALCPDGALRLDATTPIDGLAAGEPAERRESPPELDADDDGSSVEAAHHESPVQVDPRPDA